MDELTNTTKPQIAYSECYAQVFSRLFFGDCLIESDKIESGSVDLILTDLPYGNIKGLGGEIEKYKRLSQSDWMKPLTLKTFTMWRIGY